MNAKLMLAVSVLALGLAGFLIMNDSEGSDADGTFSVKIYQPTGGDIFYNNQNIPWSGGSYTYNVAPNTQITLKADYQTGYEVDEWRVLFTERFQYEYYYTDPLELTVTDNIEIDLYIDYVDYTISFPTSPSGLTTISSITAHYGTTYTSSSNTLTFSNGQTVTAPSVNGYTFSGWSSSSGTITDNTSITAQYDAIVYTFSVTIYQPDGGDIMYNNQNIPWNQGSYTYNVTPNTQISLEAISIPSGFQIDKWSVLNIDRFVYEYYTSNPLPLTIVDDIEIRLTYKYIDYTISFPTSPSGLTTISSITAHYGTTYTSSSNTLTFSNGETVTAPSVTGYSFSSWSPSSGTITSNTTITANYGESLFSVTIYQPDGGDIMYNNQNIPWNQGSYTYNVALNTEITLKADPPTGSQVEKWSVLYVEPFRYEYFTTDPLPLTVTDNIEIRLYLEYSEYTVTFNANGGTPSIQTETVTYSRPYGDLPSVTNLDYDFLGWYTDRIGGTKVTSGTTVTIAKDHTLWAHWDYGFSDVWWYNGYANGRVDVAFNFQTLTDNLTHEMTIPLAVYDGLKDDPTSIDSDGLDYFEYTSYILKIANTYDGTISVTLTGGSEPYTASINAGVWNRYVISIDAQAGTVSFNPISSPYRYNTNNFSFTNFSTVSTTVVADFSDIVKNLAIAKIYHEDTGNGTNHVKFQVTSTTTYLDTYGFVMVDPQINIVQFFPDYNNLRLNLYSFAAYGQSFTINGKTLNLDKSLITDLYYVQVVEDILDENQNVIGHKIHNVIANAEDEGAIHKELTLQNIYITWANIESNVQTDRVCSLTFVDDNFTVEMGTYSPNDLTISFNGVWYFTTSIYEPYTANETTYEMDWNSWFNLSANAFILIFMALAIVGLILLNRFYEVGLIDYLVVIGAGLVSYILLGGF